MCLRASFVVLTSLAAAVPTSSHANSAQDQTRDWFVDRGYEPLFNGDDLTGWRNPYDWGTAEVVDDEIHLTADKKFFLVTEKTYGDFRLSVDIHLPEGKANSGVMFRCHVQPNKVFGYQAECDGSERRWSGGLYDEGRRKWVWPSTQGRSEKQFLKHEAESKAHFAKPDVRNALKRNGWNRYEIECRGSHITIFVNGVKTTELDDSTDAEGYIGIQHHGEKGQTYRFRNVYLKPLPQVPAEGTVSLTPQPPQAVTRLSNGNVLVDFGRAAFGNLIVEPTKASERAVTFHFGEKLSKGSVDRKPPGTVRYATAQAKLSASVARRIAPEADARNTEQVSDRHPPAVLTPEDWGVVLPFRWVEIENWPGDLEASQFTRQAAFSSTWDNEAASFTCSDETLDRIWELCKYSIKATTFAGLYVDGDRERIPYEADAYLNQVSHYATDSDAEFSRRTFDWLMEYGTWPTEWAPHMVFMAWADYRHTGDADWIRPRYESLQAKLLMDRVGEDGLVRSDEEQQRRTDIVDWPKKERDGFVFTEINTVVNAFHLAAVSRMAELADAIGETDDASNYRERFERSRRLLNERLFDESAGIYRDGVGTDHSSHHANFFPLAFGLAPDGKADGVVRWLSKREMPCSVYAAQYYLEALFENGAADRALALITADTDRSWRHMVESGTTISWEAWDQKYKPNQDWNHAWGAAPANLLPRYVLGVQAAEAGWSVASIRPHAGSLSSASGRVPTPRGSIAIDWQTNGRSFEANVSLPAGVTAKVDLPAPAGAAEVFIDGQRVNATFADGRASLNEVVAGEAKIVVR